MQFREWVTIALVMGLFASLVFISHLSAASGKRIVYSPVLQAENPPKAEGGENFCGGKITILLRFASLLASCRDQVDSYRIKGNW